MLILRRETNAPEKNAIKIFDEVGNRWIATIKIIETDTGSAQVACIGPQRTKFLRGEVKTLKGPEGKHSAALEPLLEMTA